MKDQTNEHERLPCIASPAAPRESKYSNISVALDVAASESSSSSSWSRKVGTSISSVNDLVATLELQTTATGTTAQDDKKKKSLAFCPDFASRPLVLKHHECAVGTTRVSELSEMNSLKDVATTTMLNLGRQSQTTSPYSGHNIREDTTRTEQTEFLKRGTNRSKSTSAVTNAASARNLVRSASEKKMMEGGCRRHALAKTRTASSMRHVTSSRKQAPRQSNQTKPNLGKSQSMRNVTAHHKRGASPLATARTREPQSAGNTTGPAAAPKIKSLHRSTGWVTNFRERKDPPLSTRDNRSISLNSEVRSTHSRATGHLSSIQLRRENSWHGRRTTSLKNVVAEPACSLTKRSPTGNNNSKAHAEVGSAAVKQTRTSSSSRPTLVAHGRKAASMRNVVGSSSRGTNSDDSQNKASRPLTTKKSASRPSLLDQSNCHGRKVTSMRNVTVSKSPEALFAEAKHPKATTAVPTLPSRSWHGIRNTNHHMATLDESDGTELSRHCCRSTVTKESRGTTFNNQRHAAAINIMHRAAEEGRGSHSTNTKRSDCGSSFSSISRTGPYKPSRRSRSPPPRVSSASDHGPVPLKSRALRRQTSRSHHGIRTAPTQRSAGRTDSCRQDDDESEHDEFAY